MGLSLDNWHIRTEAEQVPHLPLTYLGLGIIGSTPSRPKSQAELRDRYTHLITREPVVRSRYTESRIHAYEWALVSAAPRPVPG